MKRRAAAAVFGQEGVENTTVDPGCNSGLRIGAGAAMGAARWRGVLLAGALLAAVATMAAGRGSRDMAIPPHGRRTLLLTELFEDSLAFDGLTRALGSLGHKVEIKARKEIKWEDPVLMDGSRCGARANRARGRRCSAHRESVLRRADLRGDLDVRGMHR